MIVKPDFIFISITLFILSAIALKMRVPKVIVPLALIYFMVLINKLSILDHQNPINVESLDNKTQINKFLEQNNLNQNKNNLIVDDQNIKNVLNEEFKKDTKVDKLPTQKNKKTPEKKDQPKIEKKENLKVVVEKKPKRIINNLLNLKEIKICRNIKSRNPVGIGEILPSSIDSLYCFTKIENLGAKMEVRHIWYYENQIMTQVRYNVKKSNTYRSWTKKTISSYQIGNWRVEIQDRNGTIIGSKRFTIKKSS